MGRQKVTLFLEFQVFQGDAHRPQLRSRGLSDRNLQIHTPLGEARESPGGGGQGPLGGRASGRRGRGSQARSQVQ